MKYFRSLPKWARDRYYAKHPDKRVEYETNSKMWELAYGYFATDKANQARMLREHPELVRWLSQNAKGSGEKFAILAAYKAIPKEEAWLRKVFREKYPELFDPKYLGEQKLKRIYDTLAKHPEMTEDFSKWVEAIWKTYEEMLRLGKSKPLSWKVETDRRVPARRYQQSLSAAEASK